MNLKLYSILLAGVSILYFGLLIFTAKYSENAAITHGCAQYNPKTGAFEWLKQRPDYLPEGEHKWLEEVAP